MKHFYGFVNFLVWGADPDAHPYNYLGRCICQWLFAIVAHCFEWVIERDYAYTPYPVNTYPALFWDEHISGVGRDWSGFELRSPGSYICHKVHEWTGQRLRNPQRYDDICLNEWPEFLKANGYRLVSARTIEERAADLMHPLMRQCVSERAYVGYFPQFHHMPDSITGGTLVWWDGESMLDGQLVCTYYTILGEYKTLLVTPDYCPARWSEIREPEPEPQFKLKKKSKQKLKSNQQPKPTKPKRKRRPR